MAAKPQDHSHLEGQLSFLESDASSMEAAVPVPDAPASPAPEPVTPAALEPGTTAAVEPVTPAAAEPEEALEDPMVLTGPNTRIRAGNAMQRARAGAIRGALETLSRRGLRRLTMSETADRGGLARATLYNHVRDKDALLALLLEHESQTVADAFIAAPTLELALTASAAMIADHPALVSLRELEPAALVRLSVPETGAVRLLAAKALSAKGCHATDADVDLLLRWLASFVASPSDSDARAAQAGALARTLR